MVRGTPFPCRTAPARPPGSWSSPRSARRQPSTPGPTRSAADSSSRKVSRATPTSIIAVASRPHGQGGPPHAYPGPPAASCPTRRPWTWPRPSKEMERASSVNGTPTCGLRRRQGVLHRPTLTGTRLRPRRGPAPQAVRRGVTCSRLRVHDHGPRHPPRCLGQGPSGGLKPRFHRKRRGGTGHSCPRPALLACRVLAPAPCSYPPVLLAHGLGER